MASKPWILGINASHNGSACLIHGSEIVVAIQEERLSRRKYDRVYPARPSLCIPYCLSYAGIRPNDLSMIVSVSQSSSSLDENDVSLNPFLRPTFNGVPVERLGHHFAHAVSAYATSGFEDCAVLVVDGEGSPEGDLSADERGVIVGSKADAWESISFYQAEPERIVALRKHMVENGQWLVKRAIGMPTFGTLGGMYEAASEQIFGNGLDSGKVMGLAPNGNPSIGVDRFFSRVGGDFVFHDEVPLMFPTNDRWPNDRDRYTDLAASVQTALEAALLRITAEIKNESGASRLAYAGGVALNSVANERIVRESGFGGVHVIPAAEDSGIAIGAAFYGAFLLTGRFPSKRIQSDAFGRVYPVATIAKAIESTPNVEMNAASSVVNDVARRLASGEIGGWFMGGSEFGPRSLGRRSILCDPRSPEAKETLNARVKFREEFRPFAPAVLLEEAGRWFDFDGAPAESPFMLRVIPVKEPVQHLIPAVVHVDGTARIQTVTKEDGTFYDLLCAFRDLTGVPVLINTSFNIMGEPIVETPADALQCLLETDLDFCAFENGVVTKSAAYGNMLDLVPRLGDAKYSAPIGAIGSADPRTVEVTSVIEGVPVTTPIPMAYLRIARLCSGTESASSIYERITQSPTSSLSAEQFVDALSYLRRLRVIDFRKEPIAR